MVRFCIFVGLHDRITHTQHYSDEKYIDILKNVCQGYHVAFSLNIIHGGYAHENGDFVSETTLQVNILNQEKSVVDKIAEDICILFNQESVMIAQSPVEMYLLRNGNEDNGK